MQGIFEELVKVIVSGKVTSRFEMFAYAIMSMYCETRRSFGMLEVVRERLRGLHKEGPLPEKQDETKNMWDTFSGESLRAKRDGTLREDTLLGAACHHEVLNYERMSQLIGHHGELLLVKQDRNLLCDHVTEAVFNEEAKKAKTLRPRLFQNVMFDIPQNFTPHWLT